MPPPRDDADSADPETAGPDPSSTVTASSPPTSEASADGDAFPSLAGITLPPPPTDSPANPRGSMRIGLFDVGDELGRGGMGTVYKAWHPSRRCFVALKLVHKSATDPEGFERLREAFLREGGILMSVVHENIVRCYEANETTSLGEPVLYMALELLEGETLAQRLKRGPLELREALRIAKCIARALDALHTLKTPVLHRDVKPSNVFLTRDGGVKLLDFGLAAIADWRLKFLSMFAAGSRPYMAPEQFDGLRFCTERSDLYSLGVTLFQALTRRCPFDADTDAGWIESHKARSPPSLRDVLPSLEPGPLLDSIQNLVTRLLAKKPEERYASAFDVLTEIDRIEGGDVLEKPRVTRPEAARFRKRLAIGVVASLLLVGIPAAAWKVALELDKSRVPDLDIEATHRLDARDLDGAEKYVSAALEISRDDPRANELLRVIDRRRAQRELAHQSAGEAQRSRLAGNLRDAAEAASAAYQIAETSSAFPDDALAELEVAARSAEEERRAKLEVARELARAAVGSSGDPSRELEDLDGLTRTDAEREKVDRLRSEWRAAEGQKARLMKEVRNADPGDSPQKALEAVKRARSGKAAARKEDQDRLDRVEREAHQAIYDDCMRRARGSRKAGDPAAAEEPAREALRHLPPAVAGDFRRAARAFSFDRKRAGDRRAREALRETLRSAPPAEQAWLILEWASSASDVRSDERLVERLDRVTLGGEHPGLANPRHEVTLPPFAMDTMELGARELTALAARAPTGTALAELAAGAIATAIAAAGDEPARGMTFAAARACAALRGKRLPSADEWEAAASVERGEPAGRRRTFPFGDGWIPAVVRWGASGPRPRGSCREDMSPWGCLDMGGNVGEWTVETDSSGRELPVVQGGSFFVVQATDYQARFQAAHRARYARPGISWNDVGFRCARDLPAPDLTEFEKEP